jgi:hypothetical protein
MLTVIIETHNDEMALARTLATLVGGAIEGVVREVIVCDRGSADRADKVAEHAGCLFLAEGGVAAAVRQAKGEWLLFLEPGARLVEGWTDAVRDHVSNGAGPARFSRERPGGTGFLERIFAGRGRLADGLLIARRQALAKGVERVDAVVRGVPTTRLPARIVVAPAKR